MSKNDKFKMKINNFFDWLQKKEEKIEVSLTTPKIVRISTIGVNVIFLSALIIGVIVAQFDPDGYNIIDNYISDLGSFNHTPLPYFLDYGAMISAFLLIPILFYMEKQFAPLPKDAKDLQEYSRMRFRLSSLGFLWMLFAIVGFFGIGLFSEDRTTPLGLHMIFSIIVFSGFVISGIFFGLLITFYPMMIRRVLGIYMIFGPTIVAVIFLLNFPPSKPFWEWMLMISIFLWIIPVGIKMIKKTSKKLDLK